MVRQYPHTVKWQGYGSGQSTNPNTGFPVPGQPGPQVEAECRYENFLGSNHREWTNKQGKTVLQKGTIYIKFGEQCPDRFEEVQVMTDTDEEVFKGEILNVYKGQMNYTLAV